MNDQILEYSDDGTIVYKKLTSKYLTEACEVTVKTIFTGGNVSETLGLKHDSEALSELFQLPLESAKDGISLVAVDKNTDKVCGVAINKILVKDLPFFEKFLETFKNEKSRMVLHYIITTDEKANVLERCNLNCMMELLFLGTSPEYRKKGIAKKLTQLSMEVAQNLYNDKNIKVPIDAQKLELEPKPEAVYGIFTSFISQKIAIELGFQKALEISNQKIQVGDKVLENKNTETATAQVLYKLLHRV